MVGYGYLGKVRKFQQPKTNTFIYVKNLGGGGQIDFRHQQEQG